MHHFVVAVGLRLVGGHGGQADAEAAGGGCSGLAEERPALVGGQVACDAGDAHLACGVVGVGDGVPDGGRGEDDSGVGAGRCAGQDHVGQGQPGAAVSHDEDLRFDLEPVVVGGDLEVVLVDGPGLVDAVTAGQGELCLDFAAGFGSVPGADAHGCGHVGVRGVQGGQAVVGQAVGRVGAELVERCADGGVAGDERDFVGGELDLVRLIVPVQVTRQGEGRGGVRGGGVLVCGVDLPVELGGPPAVDGAGG